VKNLGFSWLVALLFVLCNVSWVSAGRILDPVYLTNIEGGCSGKTCICEKWWCPDGSSQEVSCNGIPCDLYPHGNCGCTQTKGEVNRVAQLTGGDKSCGTVNLCCGGRWDCDCVEQTLKCYTLADGWCTKGGYEHCCYEQDGDPDCGAKGKWGGAYHLCQ